MDRQQLETEKQIVDQALEKLMELRPIKDDGYESIAFEHLVKAQADLQSKINDMSEGADDGIRPQ